MKKSIVMTIVLILVLAVSTVAYAATKPATAELSASVTEAKAGNTVTVTMKLSEKVLQWDYTIKYDSSVLEYVSASPAEYEKADGSVRFYGNDSTERDTFTITFNVKADAKIGDTLVSVTNLSQFGNLLADEEYEVTAGSPAKIKIIADEPGTQEPGTQEPGTQEPGTQDPGTQEPGTQEPGTQDPGTQEPGTQEPGTQEPGTQEPGTQEPGTQEPGTQEPSSPSTSDPAGSGEVNMNEDKKPTEYLQAGVNILEVSEVIFAVVGTVVVVAVVTTAFVKKYTK